MAIRLRRGNLADFDKNKLVSGELGLILDAGELHFCYSAGNTKKLQTAEDLQAMLDVSGTAYSALLALIEDLELNPSELTNILNNITALQTNKADKSVVDGHTAWLGEIDSELIQHTSQLADTATQLPKKTKQSQTALMYNRAIEETYGLPNNSLSQALSAVNGGTLKLAIWGDSISGNFDQNGTDNAYAARVVNAIKEALPNVAVTYQNFAIGGQTIYKAAGGTYVGGDTNTDTTFKTDWSVNGKSWKDHVKDFAPDLLIISFGMNEAVGYQADELEAAYLDTLTTGVQTWAKIPSIVITTTILPTSNTDYYGQSNNMTLAVSRASRLMAKSKGFAIADASRLYQILRDGKDDVTRATNSEFDLSTYGNWTGDKNKFTNSGTSLIPISTNAFVYNNREFYDGSIVVTVNPTVNGALGETQIRYRYTEDLGYFKVIIGAGSGSGYVKLFETNPGGEVLLEEITSQTIPISTNSIVKVIASGKNHTVYINDVLMIDFDAYKDLHNGGIAFGSAGTPPTFSAFTINYSDTIKGEPLYTELELLGDYNGPQSGNGINHPSGLGHALFYLPAFYGVINALSSNISTSYLTNLTIGYVAGWTTTGGYNNIKVIKRMGVVSFYGALFTTQTLTAGTAYTMFTLPLSYRPLGIVQFIAISGTGFATITVYTDGIVKIKPSVTLEIGQGVNFGGSGFTL